MQEAVIVSATRTPIGRYMGTLKAIQASELTALVLNTVLERIDLAPKQVDQVIMGNPTRMVNP